MKKILSLIILLFVLYILSIFFVPDTANKIASSLWIELFNQKILELAWKYDETINSNSWSINFNWMNDLKNKTTQIKQEIDTKVKTTQKTIDNIRTNVDTTVKTVNETKKQIDETAKNVQETIDTVSKVSNSIKNLTWTWSN